MKAIATRVLAQHPRKIMLGAMLVLFLLFGAAGEAAAHNPAGNPVPGCENGADAVANNNPNCH